MSIALDVLSSQYGHGSKSKLYPDPPTNQNAIPLGLTHSHIYIYIYIYIYVCVSFFWGSPFGLLAWFKGKPKGKPNPFCQVP